MSRLKVLLRGAQISDLSLVPDREYIGGRKESCDIRLQPEKGISREHFKLKFEDGKWILSSLSRFGEIFSLGRRIENITLEHGQVFQIPPYEFVLSEIADSIDVNRANDNIQIDENERTVVGVSQQVPYIKMMGADAKVREMLRLEVGDLWVAGRDPSCQIVIPDQRVSRRQFEIRKINGLFTVIDLGSVNGTFLNGTPVSGTEPEPLKSGDAITVLDNTMYFELHDPNFQYRMDRIEVPPMTQNPDFSFENVENEAASQESPVSDFESPPVFEEAAYVGTPTVGHVNSYNLNTSGGPFTGMPPGGAQTQSQFYNFQQAQQPPPAQLTPWQKFTQNKPLFAVVVILILAGSYYLSEVLNAPVDGPKSSQIANQNDDPFTKLKPEEKELINTWYSTAEKALKQQQFSTAKENLEKIHNILPLGYKDSKAYEVEALSGEQTIITQQETERREKEQAEQQVVLKETLAKCEKLVLPETTLEQMESCLSPATLIDPTNAEREKLVSAIRKMIDDRRLKEQQLQTSSMQEQALKELFDKAEAINKLGYPKKSIKAYKEVVAANLFDPENLKELSKKRIRLIEKKLDEKNKSNIVNAENFIKDGRLKEGILSLRSALDFDPDNQTLKDKIEKYSNDLHNQVKILYQESIIDENFGYVDGEENRPGAKDKWKKILETDLEEGDYYRKAFIKLKRYGVL